jgi:hypothetical protein
MLGRSSGVSIRTKMSSTTRIPTRTTCRNSIYLLASGTRFCALGAPIIHPIGPYVQTHQSFHSGCRS